MNDDVIQEKSRVASCINRRAVGTKDKYVAWIGEESRPKDITYVMSSGNMLAIGSP